MEETRSFIARDETNIIKGVAIVLMFIHHFFTFPSFWIDSVAEIYSDNNFVFLNTSFKICVPIFAFLTGYFYFFAKKKTFRYSIKKSTDFWICYLVVFALLVTATILSGTYSFSIVSIIKEVFALSRPTMYFCWYVIFYIGTMLVMPLFHKLTKVNDFLALAVFSVSPMVLVFICKNSGVFFLNALTDYLNYFSYLPCVLIGFIVAKYEILLKLHEVTQKQKAVSQVIIGCIMIILPFLARGNSEAFDFLYAPMFIFGLVSIVKLIKLKQVLIPLSFLGKYSLLLWFLHCGFFNQMKEFTQPVLYFPKIPILVTIWGLAICLVVAIVIQIPINGINKLKNTLFRL